MVKLFQFLKHYDPVYQIRHVYCSKLTDMSLFCIKIQSALRNCAPRLHNQNIVQYSRPILYTALFISKGDTCEYSHSFDLAVTSSAYVTVKMSF